LTQHPGWDASRRQKLQLAEAHKNVTDLPGRKCYLCIGRTFKVRWRPVWGAVQFFAIVTGGVG